MTAGADDPVSATDFAAQMTAFGPFEPSPHLAVAVSGGRDSMALVLLAHEWTTDRGGHVNALIVDHGLRPESGREVTETARRLDAVGISTVHFKADGKPSRNLQDWARRTRYALMQSWCHKHAVLHLLVAHHREDQAETVLGNRGRGPNIRTEAGIPAIRETLPCRILRPLLTLPRARLTATLEVRDVDWVEDPFNADRRFRRVRLRQRLARIGDAVAIAEQATDAGVRRRRFDRNVADLTVTALTFEAETAVLCRKSLTTADPEIAEAALAGVLQATGGLKSPIRGRTLTSLIAWCLEGEPAGVRAAAGCRIERQDDAVFISRSDDRRITRHEGPIPIATADFVPARVRGSMASGASPN